MPYPRRLQHGLVSKVQFSAWFTRGMDGATGKGELEICSTYLYRCEAGKVDLLSFDLLRFPPKSKTDLFEYGCEFLK